MKLSSYSCFTLHMEVKPKAIHYKLGLHVWLLMKYEIEIEKQIQYKFE